MYQVISPASDFASGAMGPIAGHMHPKWTKGGKKTWLLGEFEGRWATRHQGGEWGTDARDGARTGVSERLPYSPATTSTRCVWTQVHAGVVAIYSDQPVRDRCVVFDFVARWKETPGLCEHAQP